MACNERTGITLAVTKALAYAAKFKFHHCLPLAIEEQMQIS